jgi:AraC-like DNA-binding protein
MNFVPIGLPKQQIDTHFSYQDAQTDAPWRGLWEVKQAPDNAAVMRFVPDLSVHLVFDLTGQVDLEPFLLATGMTYVDLALPPGTQLIGLHFGVWDAFQLRETQGDATMIYTVKLDADWVFYLYFNLLDVRNQASSNRSLLTVLQPFQDWIETSLQNDFRQHFFAVATGATDDRDLAYSERHRRRLYQQQIGLSPKQVERIVRFQKALQTMRATGVITFDDYYDQAHFIREFREFTGMTPTAFIEQYVR